MHLSEDGWRDVAKDRELHHCKEVLECRQPVGERGGVRELQTQSGQLEGQLDGLQVGGGVQQHLRQVRSAVQAGEPHLASETEQLCVLEGLRPRPGTVGVGGDQRGQGQAGAPVEQGRQLVPGQQSVLHAGLAQGEREYGDLGLPGQQTKMRRGGESHLSSPTALVSPSPSPCRLTRPSMPPSSSRHTSRVAWPTCGGVGVVENVR